MARGFGRGAGRIGPLLMACLVCLVAGGTAGAQDAGPPSPPLPVKAVVVDAFTFINETSDFTKQRLLCWLDRGTKVEVLAQTAVFGVGPTAASEIQAIDGPCIGRRGWTSTSRLRAER